MTVPVLGDFYGIVTMTPESEFKTHVELWSFTTWRWPRLLAWAASQSIMRTINQDREVWEHRTHFPYVLYTGDILSTIRHCSTQPPLPSYITHGALRLTHTHTYLYIHRPWYLPDCTSHAAFNG